MKIQTVIALVLSAVSVSAQAGKGVMNAVFAFANSKNTWDIHHPLLNDYQAEREHCSAP